MLHRSVGNVNTDLEDNNNNNNNNNNSHHAGTCSTAGAVTNFLSSTVGTGLLSLPSAARDGGWVAAFSVVMVAVVANFTAKLLRACMDAAGKDGTSYVGVGRAAFGRGGAAVVAVLQMALLFGVCTVLLILFGNLMAEQADCVSPHIFVGALGVIMIPGSWLRSLSEVAALSYVGLATSLLTWGIVCGYGISEGVSGPSAGHKDAIVDNWANAFNTVMFAFGGHSVLPTVYESMATPSRFNVMVNISFSVIAFLYVTILLAAYWGYGDAVGGPNDDVFWSLPTTPAVRLAAAALAAHLACAFLIPLNPISLLAESIVYGESPDGLPGAHTLIRRIPIRTLLVASAVVVAYSVPYFGAMVGLCAAISVMAMVFIFPPLFFFKLCPERVTPGTAAVLVATIALGVAGTVIGLIYAISGLVDAIDAGGDVYKGFFSRKCPLN